MQAASQKRLTNVCLQTDRHPTCLQHRPSGFSLIELLIVLSIVAIIAFSASFYLASSLKSQVTQQRQILEQFIQLARQQAIIHQQSITLCPISNNSTGTAQSCVNQWLDNEWYLFIDSNNNIIYDQGESIVSQLQHIEQTTINHRLHWRNNNRFLRFSPTGSINTPGTMKYCRQTEQGSIAFNLIISKQGRIRHEQYPSSNRCP